MPKATTEEELQMPFWSHLAELRKRLVISAIAVAIGFAACFSFSEDLLGVLMIPLNMTMSFQASFPFLLFTPNPARQELFFTTLTEPFMAHLKIAFVAGLILAVPIILLQIWKFISPGLMPRERRYTGYFVSFSTLFFAAGVLFCFFLLLPFTVPFLIGYKTEHLTADHQDRRVYRLHAEVPAGGRGSVRTAAHHHSAQPYGHPAACIPREVPQIRVPDLLPPRRHHHADA